MKHTAVEWLIEQYNLGNGFERLLTESDFEEAKQMDKEQRRYSEEDMRTSFGVGMKFMIDNKLSFENWLKQFNNKES